MGTFDKNGIGIRSNLRVKAAHDASEGYALAGITDKQHILLQLMLLAVQGYERFIRLSPTYHNAVAVQAVVVEGVQGLAQFQHNIVGNVYDVVDGPNALSLQSLSQPKRRRLDGNILNHPGGIARAEVRVLDGY